MRMRSLLFDTGGGFGRDLGLLVLRLGLGLSLALAHGLGKAQRFLAGDYKFADPLGIGVPASLGLAAFGELVCGILLAVGLFGRLAAIPVAITMAVATFMIHGADPFAKKELAVVFLVGAVCLLLTGPGRLSLDGFFNRRR